MSAGGGTCKQASKFIRQNNIMTILIQDVNNTMTGYQKEILPSSWSPISWSPAKFLTEEARGKRSQIYRTPLKSLVNITRQLIVDTRVNGRTVQSRKIQQSDA